jgi:hypothetical protein
MAQPWKPVADGLEHLGCAVAVRNIRAVDHNEEHQAEGVGHDMTLATFDLLSGVIPANPANSRALMTRRWFIDRHRPLSRQSWK